MSTSPDIESSLYKQPPMPTGDTQELDQLIEEGVIPEEGEQISEESVKSEPEDISKETDEPILEEE